MASMLQTKSMRALAPAKGMPRPSLSRKAVKVQAAASYVCVDCGFIYDAKESFDKVPASYKCPTCQSPKKRFFEMAGAKRGNDQKSMIARRAMLRTQMAEDGISAEGGDLTVIIASGAFSLAVLGALAYFVINR